MKKVNKTKKQHYIAQGIISAFFDSDKVFEKNIRNGKCYRTSIDDTMCMNNSYEIPLLNENYLENLFAGSIDVDSSELIKELKKNLNKNDFDETKTIIFKNIRLLLINYYKSVTSLIHMSKDISKKDQSSIIRMINRIFNIPYIDRISELLCTGYDFAIIKSDNDNFILSDQFISTCSLKFQGKFINLSNREIGLKNTIVLIPISKDYYAIFINGNLPNTFDISMNTINYLDEKQTKIINNIIYNNSYEKCISLNEKEIIQLKKKNSTFGDSMSFVNFKSNRLVSYKIKQEVFFTDEEYEMYKYFEEYEWTKKEYNNCGVNEKCPCGSNKKYKKCCKNKVDRCQNILNVMHYQQEKLMINEKLGFEDPVQLSDYEFSEIQDKWNFLKNK